MSKSAVRKIRLSHRACPSLLPQKQSFHTSLSIRSAATLPPLDIWNYESQTKDSSRVVISGKINDLQHVLSFPNPDPNRVWGCYVDLLNFLGFRQLPGEIHSIVLRKCTPPSSELRTAVATNSLRIPRRYGAHLYEGRLQAVIRNMRSMGILPSIDDYNFVLEQFAAVGYHTGVMQVLEEINRIGIATTHKTYGLCLQALCHRVALPAAKAVRPDLIREITRYCLKILDEMHARKLPMSSVIADLAIRILKETSNVESFQRLLKVIYGIDLAYPDRPPLELWGKSEIDSSPSPEAGTSSLRQPRPLPFSTAALNTTIDFLGKSGQISRLIQTFEVLTTPLPTQASTFSPAFDDDDEDDFGVLNPRVAPYPAPSAEPNTTSYRMLLKWLSRNGHAVLARHYLLQAVDYEKQVDRRLRRECARKPAAEIASTRFAVNRRMLLAVYGAANRDKNLQLMWWVKWQTTKVIALKQSHIKYYMRVRDRWREAASEASGMEEETSTSPERQSEFPESEGAADAVSTTPEFSAFFTPSSASEEHAAKTVEVPPMPYFDVDLDAPSRTNRTPWKSFDIDLHLKRIEQDREDLEEMHELMDQVLGRTIQRAKERLGRRVWTDKDIFLLDRGRRVRIGREEWRQLVNFRPARQASPSIEEVSAAPDASSRAPPPHIMAPGTLATSRGLVTPVTPLAPVTSSTTARETDS